MVDRFRFTKTALEKLPLPPAGKRVTCYDTDTAKLALRATSSGAKTFYVIKRTGTIMAWVKLGVFPEMTVERAREEACKVLGEFASGANPAQARRAFRAEPTVTEFFTEYGERHGKKNASWISDAQRFRDYLQPALGSKKLSEVSRGMIAQALSEAERLGRSVSTLRNIRGLASGMFAKAIEWGYLEANPVTGTTVAGKKVARDRFLQANELPRFFKSLSEESNATMRDYILLALLTGARRANVAAMHWNDVDLDAQTWRIRRTKNGEPQTVTLCPEAVAVLQSRRSEAGGFVFPAYSASGHVEDPKAAFVRILKRAGIPWGRKHENGVTLHDLRRTLGSWQARTGASLTIIGKSLGHKSPQATAIYARLDLDPVRSSVNTATAAMFEAAGLKPADGQQAAKT